MIIKYWKNLISVFVFIGVLGAFLGNLNHFPVFINNFFPRNISESNIHGIWSSKYSYAILGGVQEVNVATEYFKNNSYNVVGEMGLKVNSKGHSLYVVYNIDGTGIWQIDSESLTIKLENISSWPKSVILDEKIVDVDKFQSIFRKKFPLIEDRIPSGINEEFKIVSVSDDKMILTADAPNGSMFKIVMIKKQKGF